MQEPGQTGRGAGRNYAAVVGSRFLLLHGAGNCGGETVYDFQIPVADDADNDAVIAVDAPEEAKQGGVQEQGDTRQDTERGA